MDTKTKLKIRQKLEALQDRLRTDSQDVVEEARGSSFGESAGEQSNLPMHLADMGSEEYLQDMSSILAENEGQLAQEVRAALVRLDEGTYGNCENCQEPIVKQRLEALPFARYCRRCAEDLEGAPADLNRGRARQPKDTLAPEGEMGEDRRRRGHRGDIYAAGEAGGGTEVGGLAGSNTEGGEPKIGELQDATGSGEADIRGARRRDQPHEVLPLDYESEADRERYAKEQQAEKKI